MAFDKKDFYARTMHAPDTPERAALRLALREVSRALIPQHRRLIDATRDDYAFAYAPVESPSHLLQLVNSEPFFAWLKPLTALIVDIDEMVRTDFEPADAARVADRLEQLFGASAGAAFAERYLPLLQRDVDVTVGHAALRKAITGLRRG
ncbi:MAG: hypothetical protein AABO58_18295 [Acidobacteriota bacterium]